MCVDQRCYFHLNCSHRVLCLFNYVYVFIFHTGSCKHTVTNLWEFFTHDEKVIWRIIFKCFFFEEGHIPPGSEREKERGQSSVILHQALVWKVSAASDCSLIKFSLPFVFHNKLGVIFRSCWNRLPLRVAVTSKVRWMSLQHG